MEAHHGGRGVAGAPPGLAIPGECISNQGQLIYFNRQSPNYKRTWTSEGSNEKGSFANTPHPTITNIHTECSWGGRASFGHLITNWDQLLKLWRHNPSLRNWEQWNTRFLSLGCSLSPIREWKSFLEVSACPPIDRFPTYLLCEERIVTTTGRKPLCGVELNNTAL